MFWDGFEKRALNRRKVLLAHEVPARKVKVAFFDADGTLRRSLSGKVVTAHPNDTEFLPGVKDKLRRLREEGYFLAIVSNQGGVPEHTSLKAADHTLHHTAQAVGAHYFDFAVDQGSDRKPGTGMATRLERRLGAKIDKEHSFMVGDAAYKEHGDFSDSDRKFAENLGIKFHEPHTFFGWNQRRMT